MGSGYFGLPNMGSERSSSSSSSSSRKSKKGSSDKPKQPQRGLGVAQLEQIRLRSQLGCGFTPMIHGSNPLIQDDLRVQGLPYSEPPQSTASYAYSQSSPSTSTPYGHHNPDFMMAFENHERANPRYQDSQRSPTASRWNPNGTGEHDSSLYAQPGMHSRHLYSHIENFQDSSTPTSFDFLKSMGGASSRSLDSDDREDLDLELRLSI